jgi:hypothetical protein
VLLKRGSPDHRLTSLEVLGGVANDALEVAYRFAGVGPGGVPGGDHDLQGRLLIQASGTEQEAGHGHGEVVPPPGGRDVSSYQHCGGEFPDSL